MNNIYIIIRYFMLMLMFNTFTQKQLIFQLRRHKLIQEGTRIVKGQSLKLI